MPKVSLSSGISRKLQRNLNYWKNRKQIKSRLAESLINDSTDGRPYAEVEIFGNKWIGLLDSGANVSVLGRGSESFLDKLDIKFRHLPSSVKTANGSSVTILGHTRTQITFMGQTRTLTLHIAPNLSQSLYLGVDFWVAFGLKIHIPADSPQNQISELTSETKSNKIFHQLNSSQKSKLDEVVKKFPSCSVLGLGKTNVLSHSIDVGDAKPIKQRHYPISPAVQKELYNELDRMLALGVIEESFSAWSSPIALVRRANGKVRLCLDARKVNAVTVKAAYPLPIIDGLLGRLDKTKFISSIDLKDAFWQIPLDEVSRDKTAFSVPGRPLYQFTVMPFGLCNAPQTMCRLMDRVIPHEFHHQVFVYLDDLLVTTETFEEHLELLSKVAGLISKANLTINVEKSNFVMREIRYLGYIVGNGILKPDMDKVAAIVDYPAPKTIRQLRRFLGMTGWYRRFIRSYSDLTSPLTDLLKKSKKFIWNDAAQSSFQKLKEALSSAPVLCHPDFTRKFYIQCDASKTGIGGVLFQKTDLNEERPIAYVSAKLNSSQRNYSITELECYAVIVSIKKFRHYVEGFEFTVITDHASLTWLMSQKELTGRLARWCLKLQGFNFRIEYRKGSENVVPDALSRINVDELSGNLSELSLDACSIDLNSTAFLDEDYQKLLQTLEQTTEPLINYKIINNRIFYNPAFGTYHIGTDIPEWKLYIPKSLISSLIINAHCPPSASHVGVAKTLEYLRRYYYWPSMCKDVTEYIKNCEICKIAKPVNYTTRPKMGKYFEATRPWQRLYIDFLGPYPRSKSGNIYLFVVLDQYSRFTLLQPMKDATTKNVVKFLKQHVFDIFSVPEYIFSDNGTQFVSNAFSEFLKEYGVQHIRTPKHSPQANMSERVNRSILSAIRSYIAENHGDWDHNISSIALALRNSIHQSTQLSPHFIVNGQHHVGHGTQYELIHLLHSLGGNEVGISNADRQTMAQNSILRHLKMAYLKNEKTYNLRSQAREFKIGQKVFARTFVQSDATKNFSAKLAPKFQKAYILRPVGNVAYELGNDWGQVLGIYHVKDIKL